MAMSPTIARRRLHVDIDNKNVDTDNSDVYTVIIHWEVVIMKRLSAASSILPLHIRALARRVWEGSRPLALLTLASAALLGASPALQLVDGRPVTGAPARMKPAQ